MEDGEFMIQDGEVWIEEGQSGCEDSNHATLTFDLHIFCKVQVQVLRNI